jgi:hypothetical protein
LSLIPAYLDKLQISFPSNPLGVKVTKFPEYEDFTEFKSKLTMSASRKVGSDNSILLEISPNL